MNSRHPLFDYLQRFFQVARVLVDQLTKLARRRWKGEPTLGHELLREGFERVGGSFLKLGQIMSLQVDLLPKEYCDALLSLQLALGAFVVWSGKNPLINTAHVVNGALVLGTSLLLTLRSFRVGFQRLVQPVRQMSPARDPHMQGARP